MVNSKDQWKAWLYLSPAIVLLLIFTVWPIINTVRMSLLEGYSGLKAASGRYYLGCNIENAAYSPTNCAERTAVFKAVYEGERSFDAIAIVCSGNSPAFPCGVCRQVLSEFCGPEMPVLCANAHRESVLCTLGELLPHSFGREDLEK